MKPQGAITADPNPVSVALPPGWQGNVEKALGDLKTAKIEKTNESTESNTGYFILGGIVLVVGAIITFFLWRSTTK